MADFFSQNPHLRVEDHTNTNENEERTCKSKWLNPFSGWEGPLQIPAKILFTIGDFFGMLVALAFVLHIIILVGTHGTTANTKTNYDDLNSTIANEHNDTEFHVGEVCLSLFFMWIFGLSFANLAIIPIFVFTRFSYFKRNSGLFNPILRAIYAPLTVFESNSISQFIYGIFYFLYFILFIFFLLAAYLLDKQWGFDGFDRLLLGVVVIIPLARVLLILFSYAIHAWISFFYTITCNRNRLKFLEKEFKTRSDDEVDDLSDDHDNPNDNENIDDNKYKEFGRRFRRKLDAFKDEPSFSDHENMNTIKSTTFDGGFDSPFDYAPKFARADPFLYSIYGQTTLFSWHCTKDGRTNTWSALWEIYHIIITVSTTIYLIYSIVYSMECTRNCLGCIFMFVFVLGPLTIRVRFPFYVLHSLFSCCTKVDDLFECFGCCRFSFGCRFNCKCQGLLSNLCDACCNRNESSEDQDNNNLQSINVDSKPDQNNKEKKGTIYPNFELLALSSRGLGIMSAVVYLIIILVMLVITVFILSNYVINKRVYPDYPLDLNKFHNLQLLSNKKFVNDLYPATSHICDAKPYGLSMLQYFLLCDLSYSNISSAEAEVAINEFFQNIEISDKGQMDLKKYKMGSMSYFNFEELDLTVVVIRGSIEGIDWALDIQFFLSSALLTISGPLNIFAKDDESRTTKVIRAVLAAPLKLMEQFTLFYDFYHDLNTYYENEIPFKSNIVFTGHSLGGGFAKLFGHAKGKASVSVSGPGITLFQSIVKGAKKDLYSIITEADVIPDSDIVPRVEQSAATKYRILCNEGLGTCHAIKHTLCMTGIMCNTPHEQFCRSFKNSPIPNIYDEMVDYADLE